MCTRDKATGQIFKKYKDMGKLFDGARFYYDKRAKDAMKKGLENSIFSIPIIQKLTKDNRGIIDAKAEKAKT